MPSNMVAKGINYSVILVRPYWPTISCLISSGRIPIFLRSLLAHATVLSASNSSASSEDLSSSSRLLSTMRTVAMVGVNLPLTRTEVD